MAVVFTNQQSRAAYKSAHLNNTEGVDPLADNTSNDISAEKLRQAIADLRNSAAFRKDDPYVRYVIPSSVGGTADAITISLSNDYPTSYTNAIPIRFQAQSDSTADVTININSIGASPMYKENQTRVSGGDLTALSFYECVYNSDADGSGTAGFTLYEGIGGTATAPSVTSFSGVTQTVDGVGVYLFTGSSACALSLDSSGFTAGQKATIINMGTANISCNDSAGTETLKGSDPFVLIPTTAYDVYYTGVAGYEFCFV